MAAMSPIDPRVEMFQRGSVSAGSQDAFFNMKALAPRPESPANDMYETDFEDDDDGSDFETEEPALEGNSPRLSMNSAGRRSETTLSSFEEVQTPQTHNFRGFDFEIVQKSVEGPKGPHLFRASQEMAPQEEDFYLTMSPVTPRFPSKRPEIAYHNDFATKIPPIPASSPVHRPISTLTEVLVEQRLDTKEVARWSTQQVARWMYDCGFEPSIVEKFEENDISGAILVTLKFEDLRELDIPSFGKRHKLWNEIHHLAHKPPASPMAATVIECDSESDSDGRPRGHGKKKKPVMHRKPGFDDIVSPIDSVSIVGIEQLMPKPHRCAKGEDCSRFRKQQRILNAFHKEHPLSPMGGTFLIAGNPGNPMTAEASRPFSDMVPSVVASSDVLGPGSLPQFRRLHEASLANLQQRDPQDNVKQFINFQHLDAAWDPEVPATPPYEMFPSPHSTPSQSPPLQNLRALPRLAIPGVKPPPRSASAMDNFSPGPMERGEAISPRLRNTTRQQTASPPQIRRMGTPASDMDVPYTSVNLSELAASRDASQSVPPNMNFRQPIMRSASKASRRPSFPVMPALDERAEIGGNSHGYGYHRRHASSSTGGTTLNDPFSPISGPHHKEKGPNDPNHSGWMKKRKTRMLRHEWHEHHFTLQGTRLAMHKDARTTEVLESIDVDDYAIACSSLASSKLNAAFKAMNILSSSGKDGKGLKNGKIDESAFSFQLIPAAVEKARLLRKTNGSKETHHFAVRSRDERIDWMRELMLAKALKQKAEGVEIIVNGNMI